MARQIRIEGDIAYVPLTKGYEAVIDAADVRLMAEFNWIAMPDRNTVYAVRKDCSGSKPRNVRLHRVLMGEPEGLEVDHIDGDGLNNRRANLRVATRAQNQHNARLAKSNTSGFKGVSFYKPRGKWQAKISFNGKRLFLGLFTTAEEAGAAYRAASAKIHGEFGRTA